MNRRRAAGFTLIETIAAVMLLALAFAALLGVTGSAMRLVQLAAARDQAALWARSFLDTHFVLAPLRPGHSAGRFDPIYRWQLDVAPVTPPGAPRSSLALYRLDLDVQWGKGRDTRDARFSTLRLVTASATGVGDAP